jgi:RimJ/RimL family protein N-acetyltransferase
MDAAAARVIAMWRYVDDLAMYDMGGEEDIPYLADPANGYYAVRSEEGELVAYCCFGADARVPGGDYRADAVDIGMGLPPEALGKGQGTALMPVVLQFAEQHFTAQRLRATVAAFNERARRLCVRAGFRVASTFTREDGQRFVIYTKAP